jgi:predicted amidophosphoribosyltransferase
LSATHGRMTREARTMEVMVEMYCHDLHGRQEGLCEGCGELVEYAQGRLDKCPYQEGKTTCAKCPIHCYKPALRERMRVVMRYAGPRMLWRHPIMTALHLWDGLREEPIRSKRETVG